VNKDAVQAWLDAYLEAWRSYDPAQIGALFSEDALYAHSPFDEGDPVRGRAAIVASWLEEPDAAGSWEARYVPIVVEGNVAVAQGRTRYLLPDGTLEREFANTFVMQFDQGGLCTHFTEWYMPAPDR
jgi:ketosteroid isomerase-like protein